MPTPDEISDWLDDMAQISGVQQWDEDLKCWVWEDSGESVEHLRSDREEA